MTTAIPQPLPRVRPTAPTAEACRCSCGALMAKIVRGGVEIRCRRCKRTHVIPLEASPPR